MSEKQISIKQPQALAKDFASLLNKPNNYDIVFNVADEGKKEKAKKFYGHRLILASRSEFLRDLVKDKKEVNFKDIGQNTFLVVLTWLYTGSCVIKQDYMMELIEVADRFQLDSLRDVACDYVVKGINQDTVYDLITDVKSGKYTFNAKTLVDKCISFMEENDVNIFQSKTFMKFDEEILQRILESDRMAIDEIEIFNSVVKWGKQNKKGTQTVEQTIANLVTHIRFPLMTVDQLMDQVKPSAVVPDEVYLKGLEYHIVSDGPFDKNDKAYRPRGYEKRICFNPTPANRLNFTISNGQQTIEKSKGGSGWDGGIAFCNKAISKGKTYWEVSIQHLNSDRSGLRVGVTTSKDGAHTSDITVGMSGIRHGCYNSESQNGVRCAQGDRIGVLVDMNVKQIKFFRNGYYMNTYATIYSGTTYYPVVHIFYPKDKVTIDMKDDPPKGY